MAEFPAGARKRRPSHPGEVVRLTLENLRVSPRAAAIAMGVTAQGLGKVLAGKGGVTPEMALRLGTYFGNGPELWLGMQADYDIWNARAKLKDELAAIEPARSDAA